MTEKRSYRRYAFHGRSGYIIDPRLPHSNHNWLALGHTASVRPWSDPDVHIHTDSEECYLLRSGRLNFRVGDSVVRLRPKEILVVRPRVPHAILSGEGTIEHFGIRAPARQDKKVVSQRESPELPTLAGPTRELTGDWGYRIPLAEARNKNCWLLGAGSARFQTDHLVMAYLNFPNHEVANAEMGTCHRPHFHRHSWEYYVVLQGLKRLQVEGGVVEIRGGQIVEIPPGVCHTLHSREAPFEGFTLRVPVKLNDKVACDGGL